MLTLGYEEAEQGIEEEKSKRGTILSSMLEETKQTEHKRLETLSAAEGQLLLWNANLRETGTVIKNNFLPMMAEAGFRFSDMLTGDVAGTTKGAVMMFTNLAAEEAEMKREQAIKAKEDAEALEKENKALTSFAEGDLLLRKYLIKAMKNLKLLMNGDYFLKKILLKELRNKYGSKKKRLKKGKRRKRG